MEISLDVVIDKLCSYYRVDKYCLTREFYDTIPYWQKGSHNYLKRVDDYSKIIENLNISIDNILSYDTTESSDIKWETKSMSDDLTKLESEIEFILSILNIKEEDLMIRNFCVAALL